MIEIYSNWQNININYMLKLKIPMFCRKYFMLMSQNPELLKSFCPDVRNPFHFACRKWITYIIHIK